MGRPTPETGGGTPQNQGLSEFNPLSQERRVGWGVKKLEEPKEQPADPNREAFERFLRSTPMRPAVLEGVRPRPRREGNQPKPPENVGEAEFTTWKPEEPAENTTSYANEFGVFENPPRVSRPLPQNPGEQRGEAEPSKPTPSEQQAAERLGKPPPEKEREIVETLDPEVVDMIHEAAMGDPEKEAYLLESAKKNRSLRDFFKHGPTPLTYTIPPFPVNELEDSEENPPQ
jgi:hypothetical protein